MSDLRQALLATALVLASALVLFGGGVLALVESNYVEHKNASATYLAIWEMPEVKRYTPVPGAPTFTAVPVGRETLTPTPTFAPVAGCPAPKDWVAVMTQWGDTLISLAQKHQVEPAELARANCLAAENLDLAPGIFIFVPPPTVAALPSSPPEHASLDQVTVIPVTFAPRQTKTTCGVPWDWVAYRVRSGDTLFTLGRLTGVSVFDLQRANCLGSSTLIVTGQTIYLPFIPVFPTKTALPTWTPIATTPAPPISATPAPTDTGTPTVETPTETPTATETPTPEPIPSSTDTLTPATDTLPPPTNTLPPSDTPKPIMDTITPAPGSTNSPTPEQSKTPPGDDAGPVAWFLSAFTDSSTFTGLGTSVTSLYGIRVEKSL